MPYRDPQKAREAAKLRMRKARAEKDLRKLQGRPGTSQAAPPVPLGPSLSQLCEEFLGATREEWVNQKVALGLGWLSQPKDLLKIRELDQEFKPHPPDPAGYELWKRAVERSLAWKT